MRESYTTENVDWLAVAELFRDVGWGERSPKEIQQAFAKSSFVIFIYDDETLVGFGRTMDDGRYYALLVDVVVKPSYQQQGLGQHIVTFLREQLVDYSFVTLTAAPGKSGFYQKLGWYQQSTAFIWPQSEKQRRQHTNFDGEIT